VIQYHWFCIESGRELLYRKSLEYADSGCFYRYTLYSHLLRPLMQRSSVEVLVIQTLIGDFVG